MRRPLLMLLLALGCSPRNAPRDNGARRVDVRALDVGPAVGRVDPAPEPDAGPPPAPPPPARPSGAQVTVVALTGGATVDTSLRLPRRDAAGHIERPGDAAESDAGTGAANVGQSLYPGDALTVGSAGEATLAVQPGGRFVLHGGGLVEGSGHAGASLVLSRGVAVVDVPALTSDSLRVDTPSGRVIVSGTRCTLAVADDGSTFVAAEGAGVTVWPSPPSPPARATRLTPAQIAALRRQTPDHPVLLDVEIRELDAVLRPVASRALRAGERVLFGPLGVVASPTPRVLAGPLPALLRWSLAPRPPHVAAIGVLSRGGAADVADINAAITRLRGSGAALDEEGRARVTSQLSLALGRLAARSRRGRDLAVRGGDVVALVQMARFETLRDEAATLTEP